MFSSSASQVSAANYVEDVFSTYLYTGTGASQTITNGINLSGNGGLVWMKGRSGATDHALYDTARGATFDIASNLFTAQTTQATGLTSFFANGFSIGALAKINTNAATYTSWTFCKQSKFFDIVTYTGTGANRTISHNLGSVPGCIMIKRTDTTAAWAVYHRSLTNTQYMVLNTTAAAATGATYWNSTTPTSSVFSLGTSTDVNASGGTYVAYLFAHDAGGFGVSGSDNVISCGSYVGNGSVDGPIINLGYEPQWVLIKSATFSGVNWQITDIMRGTSSNSTNVATQQILLANTTAAEFSQNYGALPLSTGFQIRDTNSNGNNNGTTYIYIAIRRGPMKTPTSGTSVFSPVARTGTGATATVTTNFVTDLVIGTNRSIANDKSAYDRLRGATLELVTNQTQFEVVRSTELISFSNNTGYSVGSSAAVGNMNGSGLSLVSWNFRRAPGFFDVVCYTGTGAVKTVNHNLGVTPELMIIKNRGAVAQWAVYHSALGATKAIYLNGNGTPVTAASFFNDTAPTSSLFTVNFSSATGDTSTYVAYLFATVAGVSKVGSYTGTAALQTINCGFSAGARFVLIKRTDSTGDWYVWDSARGISSGNDPYLLLNSTAAEVTGTNYVDTTSVGFQVTAAAPAGINASGGSYIFLAVS